MTIQNFFNRVLYGGGIVFDMCKWIILLAVAVILINKFWLTVFIVDGESMEPNMHDKELILLKVSSYNSSNPKRGDVVVVRYPGDPDNRKYVKRVIGLPGERLQIFDGKIFINEKVLEEYYLPYGTLSEPDKTYSLKDNEYFLMGDNRPVSNDSRYFGGVEKRFIIGKATTIIFPRFRQVPTLQY